MASDPAIGSTEKIKESVCEPREGGSELLEFKNPKPRKLASATCMVFVDGGIRRRRSGRATDLDGKQCVVVLV